MELKNKVIAITGGGAGLGAAMAKELASAEATVVLIDLDEERLRSVAEQCREQGGQAITLVANVTDEEQITESFEKVLTDTGRFDGLVNNAGILRDGMLVKAKDGVVTDKMPLQQWQSVIDVNLTGTFLCGREAACQMINAGNGGVIVNISSVSRAGNMGQSNYSATKSAVAALVVVWAKELARYGIRAMGIAPGLILTEMAQSMPQEMRQKFESNIPLGRLGDPTEIASTCRFIFENDYMTGRVLEPDGGVRI